MAISVEIKNIEPMSVGADGAKLIRGPQGPQGEPGPATGIASVELISGTHAAGTSDTYRITYTDGKSFDFPVYNGADGESGWDGEGAVRYDEEQGLTADEKAAVCDNIGALPLTGGTLTGQLTTAERGFTAKQSIDIDGGDGKGVYIGDTSYSADAPSLFFCDIEGEEWPVRLRNIESPSEIYDAANKKYVDDSADLFYCTVTGSGTTAKPYVCDKTYAEIVAAYDAGKLPVCKHPHWSIYGENNVLCIYQSKLSLPGANTDYVSFLCGTDSYIYEVNVYASGNVDAKVSDRNPVMTGATATENGTAGKVPSPGAGKQGHFLRGDGTWADVSSAVTGFAKIASGTYTGTGTYGADNPNSLTFDFTPKAVFISQNITGEEEDNGITVNFTPTAVLPYIWGTDNFQVVSTGKALFTNTVSVSGNGMSWYSTTANAQLNGADIVYHCTAIG